MAGSHLPEPRGLEAQVGSVTSLPLTLCHVCAHACIHAIAQSVILAMLGISLCLLTLWLLVSVEESGCGVGLHGP